MACLYSVMLPWQRNTRQPKYQNTEVYLFILCYANFGDPGINGFGKSKNATQVSKTVFSHLKLGREINSYFLLNEHGDPHFLMH